jgi:bifunctional UDP-N-acetylglucosamine pyrophosphorylase/glucosamine-1-phosphate N-acetyltransferase
VTFIDPSHAYISAEAQIGRDTIIHPNVTIEGKTVIGEGCVIRRGRAHHKLASRRQRDVKDHSMIVDSQIESNCSVGRLRTCG